MKRHHTKKWLGRTAMLCAAGLTAFGGTATFNFTTDPIADGSLKILGNALWKDTGGNPGGWLEVTAAANGQKSAIKFDDFDNGLVVKAFSISMDVRIGGGTDSPADGFSVNYARASDPVLANPDDWSNGYAGINGEANLPEEGTTTGLGIGFDAWDSGGGDVIGLSVRVDNVLVAQYPLPTKNGLCDDITSLQTGIQDTNTPASNGLLCWAPFSVNLSETGKLILKYKNHEYTPPGGLQVDFAPSPGRIIFAARTGGANQNQDIDNLTITTVPATQPTVGLVVGAPAGFKVDILDAPTTPPTTVVPANVSVWLNGSPLVVTGTKAGSTTTIAYNKFPGLFASGSTNTVGIGYIDSTANTNYVTRNFVVGAYNVIPPQFATAAGQVDTATRGFKIRSYQQATDNQNNLVLTELALAGLLGADTSDVNAAFPKGTDGFYTQAFTTINFDAVAAGGMQGSFGADEQMPGFPGSFGNGTDHAEMEILTYIEFPAAGIYKMGVDSDDGFNLAVAKSAADKLGLSLGSFNGGRGANGSGTQFTFVVQQAGIYPVRLIWENGGGGSNIEWFTVNPDGSKTLINDATAVGALKAYRNSSVPAPVPYIDLLNPANGQTGLSPATSIKAVIADGTTLTVNQGSIQMTLNGTAVTPTVSKTGSKTSLTLQPSAILPSGGTNKITLVYSDSGTPAASYTNTWSFINGTYVTLSTALQSPVGSGDATKPGFKIKTWQIDPPGTGGTTAANNRNQNLVAFAEQELQGLFGPNVANLASFTGGVYDEALTINYDITAAMQGNFGGEQLVPGIPGAVVLANPTENFSVEIQTYLEFPTAGFYSFTFNSDDGFNVTATEGPTSLYALKVNSPAAIAGALGAVSAGTDEGGLALPLPTTPITAQVVYALPALATNALSNAAAVAGKIVLIDRGVNSFNEKLTNAFNAGAIGVIVANNRDAANADGILPIVMTGTAYTNLPAVMVSIVDGQKIKDHLADAGGVTVSLGADTATSLGRANYGKGASDIVYGIVVPQPGVYPMRAVWFQGGGGGNAEWASIQPDGTKILVNDTATPGYVKAFRARTAVNRPTIAIAGASITYSGTLQSSATVNGTFTDVAGASSPYTVTATGFYRTRN
jgi:hypothetical protein